MAVSPGAFTLSPAPRDDAVQAKVHVRWDIKTGADAAANGLDPAQASQTTVAELRSAEAPAPWPPPGRYQDVENTVWQLAKADTTLVGYKHETDGDYHLVLSDSSGNTMIAEIPDPADVDPGSTFVGAITAARQAFSDQFGVQLRALDAMAAAEPDTSAPMIVQVSVPVTVTGIGFFDFVHGQAGVAPNGVELHPVLAIDFS